MVLYDSVEKELEKGDITVNHFIKMFPSFV